MASDIYFAMKFLSWLLFLDQTPVLFSLFEQCNETISHVKKVMQRRFRPLACPAHSPPRLHALLKQIRLLSFTLRQHSCAPHLRRGVVRPRYFVPWCLRRVDFSLTRYLTSPENEKWLRQEAAPSFFLLFFFLTLKLDRYHFIQKFPPFWVL